METKFLSYNGLTALVEKIKQTHLKGVEFSATKTNIIATNVFGDSTSASEHKVEYTIPLAGTLQVGNEQNSNAGLLTATERTKLNSLSNYSLPIATASVLGGVKIGSNINVDDDGVISTHAPYVHPDYFTNTGYEQLVESSPGFGSFFKMYDFNLNEKGHITKATPITITIPSLPKPIVNINAATTPTSNTVSVLSTLSTSSGGTDISHTFNSVNVPTKTYVDSAINNSINAAQAMRIKGSAKGEGGEFNTTSSFEAGDTYVVEQSFTHNTLGALEIGDLIIAKKDGALKTKAEDWIVVQKNVDVATDSALGLIKIGFPESGKNYPVELNLNKQAYVNVPWTDTKYTADNGIKLEDGVFMHTNEPTNTHTKTTTTSVTANGSTFKVAQYLYDEHGHITSSYDKTITVNNGYSLPVASSSVLGGIKIKKDNPNYTVASNTSSITANVTDGKYYGVEIDKNDQAFVYVPWTDNQGVTSVKLIQGTGITITNSGVAITETGERTISLNAASTETIGGIKVSAKNVSGATIDANRFGVKTTTNNVAYVEVLEIPTAEINALFD